MSFANTKTPSKPTAKPKYITPMRPNAKQPHLMEYYLTPELEAEFRRLFPKHSNRRIMTWFGISFSTLQRFKRQLGLSKDMNAIRKELARDVKKICEKNGYYDSIRGKKPTEQCYEAMRAKYASGWHPLKVMKEKHPTIYKRTIERRRQHRLALEAKERQNIRFGLKQQTRLHRVQCPFTRSQVSHRNNALNKGYILGDKSEFSGERYTIYYDSDTERTPLFERNLELDGFTVEPLKP